QMNAWTPWSMLGGCGNPDTARDPSGSTGARPDQEFAEPVALSSTTPAGLPLPRTAFGCGFDLLALRARRNRDATARPPRVQGAGPMVWKVRPQIAAFAERVPPRGSRVWSRPSKVVDADG